VATSGLAYAEARAGFSRRRHDGSLTAAEHASAIRNLEEDWPSYLSLEVSWAVLRDAASLSETHLIRALDAIHLASALILLARARDPVVFATWDKRLRLAARKAGLATVPE